MKRIFISLLTLATVASCSKCINIDKPYDENRVAIELIAGLQTKSGSKASVDGDKFANMTPAFFLTAFQGKTVPTDWSAVGGSGFSNEQVNSDATGAVTLVTEKYYPVDVADKLYFYAAYPASTTTTAGTSTVAPILNYTITGQEDILWAKNEVGQNKSSSAFALSFKHLLKQVKFTIVSDATFDTGWSVKSITAVNVKNGVAITLNTGVAAFTGGPANLSLPIIPGTNDAISTTEVKMDGSIMFEPGATFKVDVTVKKGAEEFTFLGVDIILKSTTGVTAGDAGVSHNVLLTFKRKQVSATATITEWVSSGADSSTDVS